MSEPTWGDVFRRHLARGMDHADAAHRADEWWKRQTGRCPYCYRNLADFGREAEPARGKERA